MRLHALIIAIKNKIPTVALIYDPKIKSTMTRVGMEEYAINISDVTLISLSDLLEKAYENRKDLTNHLNEITSQLEIEANKNALLAVEMMKIGVPPKLQQTNINLLAKTTLNLSHLLATREKHLEFIGQGIYELDNEVNNHLLVASNQKVSLPNQKAISSNDPFVNNRTSLVDDWKSNEHTLNLTSDLEKLKT